MVKRYTEQEIADFTAFYEEHGVVRLPGLIEPDWVEKIINTVDDTIARADEPRSSGSALSFGRGEGRMTIRYMWREIPLVRDFLLRPEMGEIIARIIGAKNLRFWFDLTFIHNGGTDGSKGAGTDWHHDIAAFGFKGELLPSMWMALTPANAQRSRLMFIDGSHKRVPGMYRPPLGGMATVPPGEDGFLDIPDFDALVAEGKERIVTWDCNPGDAIILHPYVIHGAQGNTSPTNHGRRVAITTRWLGEDVRWYPQNGIGTRMPGIAESNIHNGSKPDGEWFPLVYSAGA